MLYSFPLAVALFPFVLTLASGQEKSPSREQVGEKSPEPSRGRINSPNRRNGPVLDQDKAYENLKRDKLEVIRTYSDPERKLKTSELEKLLKEIDPDEKLSPDELRWQLSLRKHPVTVASPSPGAGAPERLRRIDLPTQPTVFKATPVSELIATSIPAPNFALIEFTSIVAQYLDQHLGAASSGIENINSDPHALKLLDSLHGLDSVLREPDWKRTQTLKEYPNIAGFWNDAGTWTVYLEWNGNRHAVRFTSDGRTRVLDPAAAEREEREFCQREIESNSSRDMTMFDVRRLTSGEYRVFINGEDISVSPSDYDALKAGTRMGRDHPLTRALESASAGAKVLFSGPRMQNPGPEMKVADEFAFLLQKAYPEARIYRDPLSAETNQRVQNLNSFTVNGPDEISAIIADKTFTPRQKDYHVIQDLRKELTDAKFKVVSYSEGKTVQSATSAARALIVITGHSDEDLRKFVRDLGDNGVFRDKYVMFNSCETPLTREMITEINSHYGAKATLAHQGKIQVNDLDGFFVDFAQSLRTNKGAPFEDMLRQNMHKHNLNGLWTICRMMFYVGRA